MNNKKCYGPFQLWVLNNFPFTIDDWDSVTQYQMLCKCLGALKEQLDINSDLYKRITDLENLDLQDEVNNKIDEMAESGQLQEIITEYLQINGVLAFNTVSEMISATNIINGSVCKTLGLNTYNDGKGAFYKVRTITNEDVVDGVNIIALNVSNTLIAELLPDEVKEKVETLEQNVEDNTDDLDIIKSERAILIGDSYSVYRPDTEGIEGWAVPLRRLLGLSDQNCPIIQDNGGGFIKQGSTGTFLEGLQNLSVTNKNTIKRIVVCGGLNDYDGTVSDIKSAISTFVSYCKTNYPNAKVYIGMIGWDDDEQFTINNQYSRYKVLTNVLPAYQACNQYGAIYLNGVENIMHNYTLYYDRSHPNQEMCINLANGIYNALQNGYCSVSYPDHKFTFRTTSVDVSGSQLRERIIDNNLVIYDLNENGSVIAFSSNYPTINSNKMYLGGVNSNYIRTTNGNDPLFTCPAIITDTNNQVYKATVSFFITMYDYLYMGITSPSIQDGLQVKSITLLHPFSSRPSIWN